MPTNFIEECSMSIRAWMIQILLEHDLTIPTWHESLHQSINENQNLKWFNKAAKLSTTRRRNRAIATVMPHEYISGDAIFFCLKAIEYKPPKRTYIYDVLLSRTSESKLWTALWNPPKNTFEQRLNTIVLPINVHDIHWYIAVARVTRTKCTIDIHNNLNMRNKEAEQRLWRVGIRYQEKIWNLHRQTLTQENKSTPLKKPKYE